MSAKPTEIAREAFRRMATRKILPTPENYAEIYSQVSGANSGHPAVAALRQFVGGRVKAGAGRRTAMELAAALDHGDWERLPEVLERLLEVAAPTATEIGAPDAEGDSLREVVAVTLTTAVSERLGYTPALAQEALAIAEGFRAAATPAATQRLARQLRDFWFKLEVRGEAVDDIIRGLRSLTDVLARNIADLVGEEPWLKGQVQRAQALIGDPLDPRAIAEAEKTLRDAAYRQAMIKASLDEARVALRQFVEVMLQRFGALANATQHYPEKFERHAAMVANAKSVREISDVVSAIVSDARGLGTDARSAHEELVAARSEIEAGEQRLRKLEHELSAVSELVTRDPLTELLNRRGLDQAFATEIARAERSRGKLSVAMLDLDNFKSLNTRLGHQGGDMALTHLARVMRRTLRPTDTMARYGGEEFVMLLPDTGSEEAVGVMTRLQRELTRRFFLFNNDHVFITFSAGVAERRPGESDADVVRRADDAMHVAKQSGKNRVEAAI